MLGARRRSSRRWPRRRARGAPGRSQFSRTARRPFPLSLQYSAHSHLAYPRWHVNVSAHVYAHPALHENTTKSRMKTARLVLLVTPSFKKSITQEARKQRVSVSELIRSRVETPTLDPYLVGLKKAMREHEMRIRQLELKWDAAAQVAAALKQSSPV